MLLLDHEGTHRRRSALLDEHVDLADERRNAPGDERGALHVGVRHRLVVDLSPERAVRTVSIA